ncbi:RNA-binding cell elongation regulator Jag/EloR [Clostridium tarantellae]|uniref:RNA-binding protein KhpB n=1 Tax=Clostridium tarantellae TaxID=39493 RepID=A0A6I1MLN7_9CLOT|nr:RNA-binding cell elongation regulator Jag/EloR [Clostridium tarantellae]MPQ44406.1 KH domain-containing protein [Clostridium tarantellae]
MKTIETAGKTVEEAIKIALKELNTTEDKVEYTVLDEGSKGFFNLIGTKPARISVTLKRDYIEEGKKFLSEVLEKMGISAEIKLEEKDNIININLIGKQMGTIIGYRGETLDSLQYLISLVINKGHEFPYKRVVLDTENYRNKREETLKRLAEKTAYKVKKYRKVIKLEPMNPYERRVIHAALQNDNLIVTHSEGQEPNRKIVIELKNK